MNSVENSEPQPIDIAVTADDKGSRLDVFLANRLSEYSRVKLRRMITAGGVTVDGQRTKAAYRLNEGQRILVSPPEPVEESPVAEDIPLDILFEDEHLVAINKPPAMVVHPSKGHWSGTLTAALAFHFQSLSSIGGPTRPGIVHRLDRDTSGVLVVAKTDQAHLKLAAQFEHRTAEKEYFALVAGVPDRDRDLIEVPIGVHPYHREKMAVRAGHPTSRDARTFYEVAERFAGFAALRLLPKTGRTHQLRVHLAHIGCPVLCDRLYGGRSQITSSDLRRGGRDAETVLLRRQALHARRLKLAHPHSGDTVEFEAPLPDDLAGILEQLRQAASQA